MSQTLTISDDLYSRLAEAARRHGLSNLEQYLETWPGAADDPARFQTLVRHWKQETSHLSNVAKKVLHSAYQEIIGMGQSAVPFLLVACGASRTTGYRRFMRSPEPTQCRWKVVAMLRLMVEAWLAWGLAQACGQRDEGWRKGGTRGD